MTARLVNRAGGTYGTFCQAAAARVVPGTFGSVRGTRPGAAWNCRVGVRLCRAGADEESR